MFQGFSDITGHTGNHLYNKFSELLRGRPGVRIPFGAPDNNAESLYFQRFSAFLFFAVVDGLPASRLASAFASSAGAVPKALCVRCFALYRFACGDPVLIYNI